MSFFYDAFKDFIIKNRSVVSDGEGGYITTWADGAVVKMSLTLGSAQEAREALSQRLNATFTVALPIDTPVKRDDYLQSADTGYIYRIATNPQDNSTPPEAVYQCLYCTAERTELPL